MVSRCSRTIVSARRVRRSSACACSPTPACARPIASSAARSMVSRCADPAAIASRSARAAVSSSRLIDDPSLVIASWISAVFSSSLLLALRVSFRINSRNASASSSDWARVWPAFCARSSSVPTTVSPRSRIWSRRSERSRRIEAASLEKLSRVVSNLSSAAEASEMRRCSKASLRSRMSDSMSRLACFADSVMRASLPSSSPVDSWRSSMDSMSWPARSKTSPCEPTNRSRRSSTTAAASARRASRSLSRLVSCSD